MNAAELEQLADELGIDVVGAAPAEPYEEPGQHIRVRRAGGLFAHRRFTMAQPEVSCHPERLLPTARTVVSAALCYYADEPERPPAHGRLPRYTWYDAYAELREKLDELGRRLGGDYRVLVDENQHVDREAAARSGVGFYGKNTLLITRRFGSWGVLRAPHPPPRAPPPPCAPPLRAEERRTLPAAKRPQRACERAGGNLMTPDIDRLRETERWIAWVRLAAVPFAIVEVGLLSTDDPPGYEGWAWATTGLLAVPGVGFFLLRPSEVFAGAPRLIGLLGLMVDTVIVAAFVLIYQYEIGSPVNQLFFVLLVEAAVRYGVRGGLLMPLAIAPLLAPPPWWPGSRVDNPPHRYPPHPLVFPSGLQALTRMILGSLVDT